MARCTEHHCSTEAHHTSWAPNRFLHYPRFHRYRGHVLKKRVVSSLLLFFLKAQNMAVADLVLWIRDFFSFQLHGCNRKQRVWRREKHSISNRAQGGGCTYSPHQRSLTWLSLRPFFPWCLSFPFIKAAVQHLLKSNSTLRSSSESRYS